MSAPLTPLQLLVLCLQAEIAKMQMPILAPQAFHLHAVAWDWEEGSCPNQLRH